MSQAHSRSAVLPVPLVVAQPPSVRAHSGTTKKVRFSRLKEFSLVTLRDNNPYISIMDIYLPNSLKMQLARGIALARVKPAQDR